MKIVLHHNNGIEIVIQTLYSIQSISYFRHLFWMGQKYMGEITHDSAIQYIKIRKELG